ncbi:MAG TPA: aromatic ring-hydroxylating dioxygenase subunit alpha, partial [Vicinamibacterales bacterium]|nr:aromatic ring-hydroxylating dioxygenase subunit alpha [Vicinamibacterales bacterium]
FEKERERFFRRMWVGVGRLEVLPQRGSYLTIDVAGDSLIVVRADDAGRVRAYYNLCRHRGTRLCTEPLGRFGGAIKCPYHAWTYDYEGRLLGAPHMDGSPGFEKSEFPLNGVHAGVWDGHIFVRLSATGSSLAEHLGGLQSKFRPWQMDELVRGARITYDVRANWKLIIQNYNECLHCPTLHPALNKLSHYLSGENEALQPTYMGGRMDLADGVATMSMDGTCLRDPLPGLSPQERRCVYYYSVFPNFLVAPHPDYVLVHTLWPEAVDRTRIVCDWLVDRDERAKPDFDLADATMFWDMTNRQDWHVCELAQAGISSRGYRPGPYSNREDLLYAFDRFVVRTLAD